MINDIIIIFNDIFLILITKNNIINPNAKYLMYGMKLIKNLTLDIIEQINKSV